MHTFTRNFHFTSLPFPPPSFTSFHFQTCYHHASYFFTSVHFNFSCEKTQSSINSRQTNPTYKESTVIIFHVWVTAQAILNLTPLEVQKKTEVYFVRFSIGWRYKSGVITDVFRCNVMWKASLLTATYLTSSFINLAWNKIRCRIICKYVETETFALSDRFIL